MPSLPDEFPGVTLATKANVYFDGRVVSHTVRFANGTRKTLGLIQPGSYHFATDGAERMEIVAGACRVTPDGQKTASAYGPGRHFEVAAKSGFTIEVAGGVCEYICSYLP